MGHLKLLESSVTWGVISLVLAAVASTGKLSVSLANFLLVVAFAIGGYAILQYTPLTLHPKLLLCLLLAAPLIGVSWWLQPAAKQHTVPETQYVPKMEQEAPQSTQGIMPRVKPKKANPELAEESQDINTSYAPRAERPFAAAGNLRQRASALAERIIHELCIRGWQSAECRGVEVLMEMPAPIAEQLKWEKSLSRKFTWMFFDKIVAIREEFAQLHYRDEVLDRLLDSSKDYSGKYDKMMFMDGRLLLNPRDIESIAVSLKKLSNHLQ